MKRKKDLLWANFKDPNISDREMLLLILFEMANLSKEVRFIKEYLALEKAKITPEIEAKLWKLCHDKAFESLEFNMLQFVRWNQKKNKKVDLN